MLAGLAALAAAAAAAAETKAGLPQLNQAFWVPQLIWLGLTFCALYLLMSQVALPRIGKVIETRANRIQGDLAEAERLKADTQAALADYEDALATARGKATGIAKETREKLGAETETQRAKVEREVSAKLAEAEARIAATKSQAMSQVGDIAREVAEGIVTRLTGKPVSADELSRALTVKPGE